MPETRRRPRRIVLLAYPGVQSLDLTGPLEVFHGAGRAIQADRRDAPGYAVEVVAAEHGAIETSSGLPLLANRGLEALEEPLDTLIVPGGDGRSAAARNPELMAALAAAAGRARRTAGVCTGAFLLAAAGLLDGRRVTTHWAFASRLADEYPQLEVDADPIFIRDGDVWTSAGVTAGMDLALALVEDDHDRELALLIARHLVLFLRRPGSQAQFSAALDTLPPRREPLRELQRYVAEHVDADLAVEAMARRVHMSPRHFARAFRAETGVTPARYVQRVRLESARRRLEDGGEPLAEVASRCGFGTAESMRRAFVRGLQVSPAEYRRRFQASARTKPARSRAA